MKKAQEISLKLILNTSLKHGLLIKSLESELRLYRGRQFNPVEWKALVIICSDYRLGAEGPNKMKNPPKDILENEMNSYIIWLKRIGLQTKDITLFNEPSS